MNTSLRRSLSSQARLVKCRLCHSSRSLMQRIHAVLAPACSSRSTQGVPLERRSLPQHALPTVSADTPQHVAVACDDGALRLFTLEAGAAELQYHRSLPRTEGRVLAVAWHPSAQMVVTGTSVGHLHVWEVATSREVLRITAGEITLSGRLLSSGLAAEAPACMPCCTALRASWTTAWVAAGAGEHSICSDGPPLQSSFISDAV